MGAGFGGLAAAKRLLKKGLSVHLIDRNNYHLFQPLLYQVAAAYLAPEEIAKPIRAIFRGYRRFSFQMGEVTKIDFDAKTVHVRSAAIGTTVDVGIDSTPNDGGTVGYDYLIIATGAQPNFFGKPGLTEYAFSLKYLEDAVRIRSHIIACFEDAVFETDSDRRRTLLTFSVGGGGSAGVEMAGALAELVNQVLVRDYSTIDRSDVSILLLEGGDHILPDLPNDLSERAVEILERKGVQVQFGTFIEDFTGETISLRGADEPLRSRTLVWTGGIRAAEIDDTIASEQTAQNGRIRVNEALQLSDHAEVFAIGDVAHIEQPEGPVPMVAPAAVQTAELAAANILRSTRGIEPKAFVYKSPGALATIGRGAAVAEIYGMKFRGFSAWLVWLVVHLIRLVGFRNRLIVLINWTWDYFFFERASRLVFKQYLRRR